MKKVLISFLGIAFLYVSTVAQIPKLEYAVHNYRLGKKVDFQIANNIDPGEAGAYVLWDFSSVTNKDKNLTSHMLQSSQRKNADFILNYNNVIREYDNEFFFEVTPTTMEQTGLVTSCGTVIRYDERPLKMRFGMTYGDHYEGSFSGEQISSTNKKTQIKGRYSVMIDGFGDIILPDGQKFEKALRLRTERVRIHGTKEYSTVTYRWYLPHVTYPVLVTIQQQSGDQLKTTQTAYQKNVPVQEVILNNSILDAGNDLISVYPNPYRDRLFISYNLDVDKRVNIDVYNISGERVQTIVNDEMQIAGNHEVSFSAKSNGLPSGLYSVRVALGEQTFLYKVVEQD